MIVGLAYTELEELNRTDLALARMGDLNYQQGTNRFRHAGCSSLLTERLIIDLVSKTMQRMLLDPGRVGFGGHEGGSHEGGRLKSGVVGGDVLEAELSELLLDAKPRPVFLWAYYQSLGIRRTHRLHYVEADALLSLARSVSRELDDPLCEEHSILMLGRSLHRQGQAVKALQLIADTIQTAHSRSVLIPSAHSYIAEIFEQQHHLEAALMHRRASVDPDLALLPRQEAEFNAGLANLLISLGRLDTAGAALEVATVAARRLGWAFTQALVDSVVARFEHSRGNTQEARELISSAVKTLDQMGNRFDALQARLVEAKMCADSGKYGSARALVDDEWASQMPRWFQVELSLLRASLAQNACDWPRVVANQHIAEDLEEEGQVELTKLYPLLRAHEEGLVARNKLREIELAHQRLTTAQQDKADLLNAIAHDLQSPLMSLDLTLKFLETDSDGTVVISRIESADETIRRVQGLVQQLDTAGGQSPAQVAPVISIVPLRPMIERVTREFASTVQAKNIRLWVEDLQEESVLAAKAELEQILGNLVSNAVKFSPRDTTIVLSLETDEDVPDRDRSVRIKVQDEGQGLSQRDLHSLFSKYARLSSRPTNGEPSTGMGLYIAQSSARSMGGDIVASSPGKGQGSTFVVSLRRAGSGSADTRKNQIRRQAESGREL